MFCCSGFNADVICLQEVDRKIFDIDLFPFFMEEGFDGLFCGKFRLGLEAEMKENVEEETSVAQANAAVKANN